MALAAARLLVAEAVRVPERRAGDVEAPELPEHEPVRLREPEHARPLILDRALRVRVEVEVRARWMRGGPPLHLVEVLLDAVRCARLAVLEARALPHRDLERQLVAPDGVLGQRHDREPLVV